MIIYFSATIISMLFAFLSMKERRLSKLWFGISFLPLFLVAALRKFVGTDYIHYYYTKVPDILNGGETGEMGYQMLSKLGVLILGDFQWVIAITAFFFCFFFYKTFARDSKNIPMSIAIFVAIGIYYFSLNGMRQALVIAIFFYSIKYIEKQELKKYLISIVLASTFHLSALLYIPFYFLTTRRISNKLILVVSASLYLVWPFLAHFLYPIVLGKYVAYFVWGSVSGYNWRFLIPLLSILTLHLIKEKGQKKELLSTNRFSSENIYRNLFIFAFWACNLAPTLTGESSARAIFFFLPAITIYLPFLLLFYSKKIKYIAYVALFCIFIWMSNANGGWVLPYHSVFSDYSMSYNEFIYRIYENKD